jgi:5-formyltetrahydrofolate cyclo-ligase
MSDYKKAKLIMAYVDYKNEVITNDIISYSLEKGKRVVVPVTEIKTKKMTPCEVINYPEDLISGNYGIMEPKEECIRPVDPKIIDLILIPGVAFDVRGNRLGYGAGYYDRFLMRLNDDAVKIALAYEMQILENVYPEKHDVPIDFIITEKRVIDCKN